MNPQCFNRDSSDMSHSCLTHTNTSVTGVEKEIGLQNPAACTYRKGEKSGQILT